MKLVIFIMLLLSTLELKAQGQFKNIELSNIVLEQRGDSLDVRMEVNINSFKINTQKEMRFTPYIVYDSNKIALPPISIRGRENYIGYQRLRLSKKRETNPPFVPNYIIKGNKVEKQRIYYKSTIKFHQRMKGASVVLEKRECGCCTENIVSSNMLKSTLILDSLITPYIVTPYLAYVIPKVEEQKQRESVIESCIDFENNSSVIKQNFMANALEINRINSFFDELYRDKSISITHITIIGYASPEGELNKNKQLSERRAMALKNYLIDKYSFDKNLCSVSFGGENWEGVISSLEKEEIPHKNAILEIIKNSSVENGREKKLMTFLNGEPYKYMLKHIFPRLRVAKVKVEYKVKNFSLAEAIETVKIKPQHLSLNELFIVANSFSIGSVEFCELFETAVRLYPQDETSILNAAIATLSRGDKILAERYLNQVSAKNAQYYNAMGVLLMLNSDYIKAEEYLKIAQKASLLEATKNLEELYKKRESDELIMQKRIK